MCLEESSSLALWRAETAAVLHPASWNALLHLSSLCGSLSDTVFFSFLLLRGQGGTPAGERGVESLQSTAPCLATDSSAALYGPTESQHGFALRKRDLVIVPSPQGAMPGLIALGFWKPQSIGKHCKEPDLPVQECIFLIYVKHP